MKTLQKVIKDAVASDKCRCGTREVLHSVKASKLVIASRSLVGAERQKVEEQVKSANVALYEFPGNSVQLGKLCSKPFRVKAVAIRSGTGEEIDAILSEAKEAGGSRSSSK